MTLLSYFDAGGRFGCDVVLVEDDKDIAEGVAIALRRSGISVQVALDQASARALARECEPRVCLVDYALPDGDGPSLVRELSATWKETTFILLSGQVGGLTQAVARNLRIRAFLNKPIPITALRDAIRRLLREPKDEASMPPQHSWLHLGIGSPRPERLTGQHEPHEQPG